MALPPRPARARSARPGCRARRTRRKKVIHPRTHTWRFARPKDIVRAERRHTLVPLPSSSRKTYVAASPFLGQLAHRLHHSRRIYRALRPSSLSVLLYIGQRVHQLSGSKRPLLVTSAVRDLRYQRVLKRVNENAARTYSVHTTGYAFDLARSYSTRRQAAALQFVLDRLEALNLIAYMQGVGRDPRHGRLARGPAAALAARRRLAQASVRLQRPERLEREDRAPGSERARPRRLPGDRPAAVVLLLRLEPVEVRVESASSNHSRGNLVGGTP